MTPDPARYESAAEHGRIRYPAVVAAALAFASALVSLYWTMGGTYLLDTVGGLPERWARDGGAGAVAIGLGAALAKIVAGGLALALVRPPSSRLAALAALWASAVGSVVLVVYGGLNVAVGGLVLLDAVTPDTSPDLSVLRWHVLIWDLWFLLWGIFWAVATYRRYRTPS